jgi:hypothetical protein
MIVEFVTLVQCRLHGLARCADRLNVLCHVAASSDFRSTSVSRLVTECNLHGIWARVISPASFYRGRRLRQPTATRQHIARKK